MTALHRALDSVDKTSLHASTAVRACALLSVAFLVACGDGNGTGPQGETNRFGITETGPGVLSVSPLDTSNLVAGTPLGALSPPGHVLPTDHVYLYFVNPWNGQQQSNDCRARPVRAAGSGVIFFTVATEAAGDTKVDVQMTKTFHYYYDHVILKPGLGVGSRVNAGDTIAMTTGRCPSIDLGVWDLDVTAPGLVNGARYPDQTLHSASPYKYFSEPLRSWLYARVRMYEGAPADRDGRIGWGMRGRLAGDWFHASLSAQPSSVVGGPSGWPRSVSFARDWFDGSQRISIGGTLTDAGVVRVESGDPDPASVSVADGIVAYRGTPTMGRIGAGWMLVQMLSDERARFEYFSGATSRPSGFTPSAQEYVR